MPRKAAISTLECREEKRKKKKKNLKIKLISFSKEPKIIRIEKSSNKRTFLLSLLRLPWLCHNGRNVLKQNGLLEACLKVHSTFELGLS